MTVMYWISVLVSITVMGVQVGFGGGGMALLVVCTGGGGGGGMDLVVVCTGGGGGGGIDLVVVCTGGGMDLVVEEEVVVALLQEDQWCFLDVVVEAVVEALVVVVDGVGLHLPLSAVPKPQ